MNRIQEKDEEIKNLKADKIAESTQKIVDKNLNTELSELTK